MPDQVTVHPLVSPWGRFGLYTFFIDAPEPAIVDTGIAGSPAQGMAPALRALGRDIADVRWILLTHGHIDHLGGAHELWEMTGRKAQVVIHEADADLLRSRRAHVEHYLAVRDQYLDKPTAEAEQTAMAREVISGEMEPTLLVSGGETLWLGGDVSVSVLEIPGHTPGSVAYLIGGQESAFVGDAVQIHGAANGFPGYESPDDYRSSLEFLQAVIRPQRLYLGHPYRSADGTAYGVELDREQTEHVLAESRAIEARVRATADAYLNQGLRETDSAYSPFEAVASELGYTADPTLEPSPFFTTLHGYRTNHHDHKEFRCHG